MHKLLLLSLLAVLIGQTQAFAQDVADQPCDPRVYNQMSSRAWLEAEREIMQNQNLIFKADSVLEYTCFDQFLTFTGGPAADIFSESAPTSGSLNDVVFKAMEKYIGNNFLHSYLGGRATQPSIALAPTPFVTPGSGANYTCTVMKNVWEKAKCMNFIHGEEFKDIDGFYPFDDIICPQGSTNCTDIAGYDGTDDKRKFPSGCPGGTGLFTWNDQLKIARNQPEVYNFQSPLGTIFLDVFEKTEPGNCQPGILTGVTVVLAKGPAHDDGVCSNPGCTYGAGGGCN